MTQLRLPLLVLAAPLFLSACGDSVDEPVQTHQASSARSSSRTATAVAPSAVTVIRTARANFAFDRTDSGYDVTDYALWCGPEGAGGHTPAL